MSAALKQSLAVYQLQWKSGQNHQNQTNPDSLEIGKISSRNHSEQKRLEEELAHKLQQNKKSIQNLSYNSDFLKNNSIQQKHEPNQMIVQEKICYNKNKDLKTACDYSEKKKEKNIRQNQTKYAQDPQNRLQEDKSIIDLYEPADIPHNNLTSNQIQQKKQKLLLRRVLNWKQIDKKVGFRKMELKKLLG